MRMYPLTGGKIAENPTWARLSKVVPIYFGPGIVAAAILGVHVAGLAFKFGDYVEAPPTVSRTLVDPQVGDPFAWAMIIAAFLLAIAISQVGFRLFGLMALTGHDDLSHLLLLGSAAVLEVIAIAGMIVLSQYTGAVSPPLHDLGSYMLFFGHGIGLSLTGLLVRRLLLGANTRGWPLMLNSTFLALSPAPRRAVWVAVLSTVFGVTYFGGKFLPDSLFFWQRTVLSITELIVILYYLWFLVGFAGLLRVYPTKRLDGPEG